ncbi:YibE/F family protein [Lapidilactobacillus wuchangensis]|uniref:YibE/F family protein n=1 Tax=Lapidilactobacillus wuchangensis TaxID=2486001 RepID=UPI00384E32DE
MQKKTLSLIIIAILGLVATVTIYFRTNYTEPLAVITQIKTTTRTNEKDQYDNRDQQITQTGTLKLLNTNQRGQTLTFTNTYDRSQLVNQRFQQHQRVFVQVTGNKATINNAKRDWVLVLAVTLLILLIVQIMAQKSYLVMLSLLFNIIIFGITIRLDIWRNGTNPILIYSLAAIIFAVGSFLIFQGWHLKMAVMLLSTISALLLAFALSYGIMAVTKEKGITYMAVAYATQSPRSLFLGQTLLGVLGAVMDESTDIVTSLNEVLEHRPDVSTKQFWQSGLAIGREIMGPLINVLFLIFMADALPMTILYLRDNNSINYTFTYTLSLGVIQSLISAIGIVLTVPIATLASLLLRRKQVQHE